MQIVFDMDGTIADLYSVENWEARLRASDPTPYIEATPLVNMDELRDALEVFRLLGGVVSIVSWSAMGGSKDYNKEVKKAKREWCENYGMPVDNFHVVKYGTKKWYPLKNREHCVLFDDNADVREAFVNEEHDRAAYDVTNILDVIQTIIQQMRGQNQTTAEQMIQTALDNKIMAYCYEATDHENERFIKIGMTTVGEERINNYCYKINPRTPRSRDYYPHSHKYICFYPCRTKKDAEAMENALREFFLQKCGEDVNGHFVPHDRFYGLTADVNEMVSETGYPMKRYHEMGY